MCYLVCRFADDLNPQVVDNLLNELISLHNTCAREQAEEASQEMDRLVGRICKTEIDEQNRWKIVFQSWIEVSSFRNRVLDIFLTQFLLL